MARTITIYFYNEVEARIDARGENRSQTVNRDLLRLYALYERALQEIDITTEEAHLIADALNGVSMEVGTVRAFPPEIEDAINYQKLDKKWNVDGTILIEKLKKMNALQLMALVDAAERFWALPDEGKTTEEKVRKIFNIQEPEK